MGKHHENEWACRPLVFTETADNPTAEVVVPRFLNGRVWYEWLTVSPYRATHRFHDMSECTDPNACYMMHVSCFTDSTAL